MCEKKPEVISNDQISSEGDSFSKLKSIKAIKGWSSICKMATDIWSSADVMMSELLTP